MEHRQIQCSFLYISFRLLEESSGDAPDGRSPSYPLPDGVCSDQPTPPPAGVHGALLVHEPRFTGELMASVLSIPASKSLLRRHLFTRFNELVGAEILREKREVEDNQSIAPLRPDSKVKVGSSVIMILTVSETRCCLYIRF